MNLRKLPAAFYQQQVLCGTPDLSGSRNNALFVSAPISVCFTVTGVGPGFCMGCASCAMLMGYCWSKPVLTANNLTLF